MVCLLEELLLFCLFACLMRHYCSVEAPEIQATFIYSLVKMSSDQQAAGAFRHWQCKAGKQQDRFEVNEMI